MEFLFADWLGTPAWFWLAFAGIVLLLTAFDLGVLNRENRELGVKASLKLSAFYIAIALAFGGWVWFAKGEVAATEYLTGYFIEKALSIDNVFVISMIFALFSIAPKYQYRALVWGILAVIVLRALMIAGGAALIAEAGWVMYLFAGFLILTGIKMLFGGGETGDIGENRAIRWIRRVVPVAEGDHGQRFFVRAPRAGKEGLVLTATPLFLALVVINFADLLFAVDSVPAIFAITTDTFIVYTSNIMAILGLRALYFALAAMVHRFHLLSYALALVLVFIGGKIFYADFVMGGGKIPPLVSLGVTLALIGGGVVLSWWKTRNDPPQGEGPAAA